MKWFKRGSRSYEVVYTGSMRDPDRIRKRMGVHSSIDFANGARVSEGLER